MVVVGVVTVVPCTPGVISIGSGDVVRIRWVRSWSKDDLIHGLWIGGGASQNVGVDEIDDVEEPRESGVVVVSVVCMEMGFCGSCRVSWMIDDEGEENEVARHVEENSEGDENVQKVDGNVVVES